MRENILFGRTVGQPLFLGRHLFYVCLFSPLRVSVCEGASVVAVQF